LQKAETEVIAEAAATVTVVLPDLLVSWTEVAVIVAVWGLPDAVKSPEELIATPLVPVTFHETAELKSPVPVTVAAHCELCPG
jgi:hypothetical protein